MNLKHTESRISQPRVRPEKEQSCETMEMWFKLLCEDHGAQRGQSVDIKAFTHTHET